MKLKRVNAPQLLTTLYATLTVGMLGFSLLAYVHPLGQIWGGMAFLCFLLIVFAFALDAAIDGLGRWKRR